MRVLEELGGGMALEVDLGGMMGLVMGSAGLMGTAPLMEERDAMLGALEMVVLGLARRWVV